MSPKSALLAALVLPAAAALADLMASKDYVTQQVARAESRIGSNTVAVAAAAAADYMRTNPPTAGGSGTDLLARAAAAYAYSPTNPPPALTNILIGAQWTNGNYFLRIINP